MSAIRKYGNARADSAAAAPNALAKPYFPISHPIVVEPVPIPVSNAARIAPKAAPRRSAPTCRITYPTNAGYAVPKPIPKIVADSISQKRVPPMVRTARPAEINSRHGRKTRR